MVTAWIVVILLAFFTVGTMLAYEGEIEITNQTESGRAFDVLAEGFPRYPAAAGHEIGEVVVVRVDDGDVDSSATQ